MRRRKFILKTAYFAITTAMAALPYSLLRFANQAIPGDTQQLRPPGAAWPDEDFVDACIGCGLCGEVCPPRCIKFNTRAGGDSLNTPFIEPMESGCTLCGKCMDVCPTDALTKTPVPDVKMGQARIDRAACYPWVDKGVCGVCVAICPLGARAIGYEFANMYRPVIQSGCVGCGLCVEVCPEPSLPIRVTPRRAQGSAEARGV